MTWHPDVRFFDIRDRDGALIGQFYLDLYAREGKQSGAWMDDAINRRRDGDGCSIRSRSSRATSLRRPSSTAGSDRRSSRIATS